MDPILWLIIGGVIGFLGSVAANLLTGKIVSLFERQRGLMDERSKDRAMRFYSMVTRLHDGRRDRYVFFILSSMTTVVSAIFGVVTLAMAILLTQLNKKVMDIVY